MLGGIALTLTAVYLVSSSTTSNTIPADPMPAIPIARSTNVESLPIDKQQPAIPVAPGKPAVPDKPEKNAVIPKKIVFPAARAFRHDCQIGNPQEEKMEWFTCVSKMKNKTVYFVVRLVALKRFNTPMEVGHIEFFIKSPELDRSRPPKVTLRINNQSLILEGFRRFLEKENAIGFQHSVEAVFNLEQFAMLLNADKANVTVDNINFEFDDTDLEAMRDVASRFPDGKTAKSEYIVKHAVDAGMIGAEMSPVDEVIKAAKAARLSEYRIKIEQIEAAKSRLRTAIIEDDKPAVTKWSGQIAARQQDLRKLMSQAYFPDRINLYLGPSEGQVGGIGDGIVKVMRIINRPKGELLIYVPEAINNPIYKLIVKDATGLEAGKPFPVGRAFVVVGKATYETVLGENTMFELHELPQFVLFTEQELNDVNAAIDPDYVIRLTVDEELQAKEFRAKASVRRRQFLLDAGKALLKKGNREGARKQFEKVITDDEESEAGKEAAKLLESVP